MVSVQILPVLEQKEEKTVAPSRTIRNNVEATIDGTDPTAVGGSRQMEKAMMFSSAEGNQRHLSACLTATCQSLTFLLLQNALPESDQFPPLPTSKPKSQHNPATPAVPPPAILLNPAAASRLQKSFLDVAAGTTSSIPTIATKSPTFHKGAPAIHFSMEEIQKLAEPFKFTLVGKFSKGRPPMDRIREFIVKLGLTGPS